VRELVETKDIVESRFEEAKKKVIAKHDEFVREIEETLNRLFTKFSSIFSKQGG